VFRLIHSAEDTMDKLDPFIVRCKDDAVIARYAAAAQGGEADITGLVKDLAADLRKRWNVDFDDAGAIGRRYRRQDEIGTPFCITVDFDTLDDQAVTVRERDTMGQERIGLDAVVGWLAQRLPAC
jgi:glycyl-tRNA synthetase (class II)